MFGHPQVKVIQDIVKLSIAKKRIFSHQIIVSMFSNTIFLILDHGVTTQCAPPTLLASLLQNTEEMMVLHNRLKLSGFERDMALFVINHRNDADMKGNKNGTSILNIN